MEQELRPSTPDTTRPPQAGFWSRKGGERIIQPDHRLINEAERQVLDKIKSGIDPDDLLNSLKSQKMELEASIVLLDVDQAVIKKQKESDLAFVEAMIQALMKYNRESSAAYAA